MGGGVVPVLSIGGWLMNAAPSWAPISLKVDRFATVLNLNNNCFCSGCFLQITTNVRN